jgi:hypothetical protein
MEHEKLEYKVVMEDGPDSKILGRLAHLDLASAAYLAAIARFPAWNIQLRQGAYVVKHHDGEPTPEPPEPVDPNLRTWSVSLIGKKLEHCGFVQAANEAAAIEVAVVKFGLDQHKRKRLAVSPAA